MRKVKLALDIAMKYGQMDGEKHKAFAIDQMVRALTGCQLVKKTAFDCNGKEYEYETMGECDQYLKFVSEYCYGENGPDTYSWNRGV